MRTSLYDKAFVTVLITKIFDEIMERTGSVALGYRIFLEEAEKFRLDTYYGELALVRSLYTKDGEELTDSQIITNYTDIGDILKYSGGILPHIRWKNKEVEFFYTELKKLYFTKDRLAKAKILGINVNLYHKITMNMYIRLAKFILTGDHVI